MLQGIEVFAPTVWYAAWIVQVVLVHFLDIGRVAAEEVGAALVGGVDGFSLTHISLTFVPLQGTLVG